MKTIQEIETLISSRMPILYILGYEEQRYIDELKALGQDIYVWTSARGMMKMDIKNGTLFQDSMDLNTPLEILEHIASDKSKQGLYVLCDFHLYLNNPVVSRALKDCAHILRNSQFKNVIIIAPSLYIPMELEKEVYVIDYKLPNSEEVKKHVKNINSTLVKGGKSQMVETSEKKIETIVNSVIGLTYSEIDNSLSTSLVKFGKFNRDFIIGQKKQIIKKSDILIMPELDKDITNLNSIGGLNNCKRWLDKRKKIFLNNQDDSKMDISMIKNNIPFPKGALLIGVQGCGKSYLCKCLASDWNVPLLLLDMGKVFAQRVGESESKMRNALKTIDSMEPCVLFIDEMEKAFAGVQSSSMSDGGTTARVVSCFLNWMQERKSRVFIMATANDISTTLPELIRKGRLDEIFFIDLPGFKERMEILKIHFKNHNLTYLNEQISEIAAASAGFSGAEIKNVIIDTLYDAYITQKKLTSAQIIKNIKKTNPISVVRKEEISGLRKWAASRCVPASDKTVGEETAFQQQPNTIDQKTAAIQNVGNDGQIN